MLEVILRTHDKTIPLMTSANFSLTIFKMNSLKTVILFLALSNLIGCVTNSIRISPDLIQPYSDKANAQEKFQVPYIAAYKKGPHRLWFVGAEHVANSDNPTCQTIRQVFQDNSPNFLIVEGMAYSQINDPAQIAYAKKCEETHYKNCGEDACAINEAFRRRIAFNYGEPTDSDIKEAMIAKGYSDRDLIFFYALRQVPHLKRQGIVRAVAIRDELASKLPQYSRRLQTNATLSLLEFEKFYLAKLGNSGELHPSIIENINRGPSYQKV